MGLSFSEHYPEVKARLSFEIDSLVYSAHSPYQKIDIVESSVFGRMLLIDNMIMLTEKDEYIYHEMIAHVPLFVHPAPEQLLIIGGGDGGTVRECLKHAAVKHIDLVDIDEMVTRACLQYIPSVAGEILSKRVKTFFQDGVEYVKKIDKRYDVVIIDSTDPVSVGEGLFTPKFYRDCYRILKEDGILINQSESPAWQQKTVAGIFKKLKSVFESLYYYQAHIPTYPSGHWLFGFASKKYHPQKDFRQSRYHEYQLPLRYYNDALHSAAFALPTFIMELLHE
jgi:spermidine synthase